MADLNLKIPAVEKLIDYAASGIGAVAGPMVARRQAQAAADAARIDAQGQADAARIDAQGQADVMRIQARGQADSMNLIASAQAEARNHLTIGEQLIQGEITLRKEIESRLTFQEQKRQNNIGAVVGLAADALDDKEVQNHEPDHDWVARFFSDVQDVTSEHMQRIWAKILAGEVEAPGRTSLHTLSILKNMTQRDAKLFEEVSRFIFDDFILNEKTYTSGILGFPTLKNMLDLESYGLLNATGSVAKHYNISPEGIVIPSGKIAYRISTKNITFHKEYTLTIPGFPLSLQGSELYHNIKFDIDKEYLHVISKFLNDNGSFSLEYAEILQKLGEHVRIGPLITVEPSRNDK